MGANFLSMKDEVIHVIKPEKQKLRVKKVHFLRWFQSPNMCSARPSAASVQRKTIRARLIRFQCPPGVLLPRNINQEVSRIKESSMDKKAKRNLTFPTTIEN